MRFVENGADIPNELLLAHDNGHVVFFCGSGVSKANANLPDFDGLAQDVLDNLGVAEDDEVRQFYNAAKEVEEKSGVKGVSSPDRIFSLLSRKFDRQTINNAVASSLKISPKRSELRAHKTLLKLARGQNFPLRLITTNFDRLFELADPSLQSCTRANLPHVQYNDEDWGIVHLHGQVNEDSSDAGRDGFVLSSAEFGNAYLAQGWAREFVRNVIEKYVTVFVGYSADDPPIRYLLEGLNEAGGLGKSIYAFQEGADRHAKAGWDEKQVCAITYCPSNNHSALWNTMEAWTKRASNPAKWRTSIFRRASRGPDKMKPFVRGMVAHIVSNLEGSAALKNLMPPLPATWLCVFDKKIRFSQPGLANHYNEKAGLINPYELYSLDSDPPPIGKNEEYSDQQIPSSAWDAFDITDDDLSSVEQDQIAALHGHYASRAAPLPKRLSNLSVWIKNVADQPAAVWWAARQTALHHNVLRTVSYKLQEGDENNIKPMIKNAWHDVFSMYRAYGPDNDTQQYDLERSIQHTGWAIEAVNQYSQIFAPKLKAYPLGHSIAPPTKLRGLKKSHLIRLEVKYPDHIAEFHVPDEQLSAVLNVQRRNIEMAIDYETAHSGYLKVCPIEPEHHEDDDFIRRYELSGYVLHFVSLFERLLEADLRLAKAEYKRWRESDPIFKRLRIWAAGKSALASSDEFADEVITIDRSLFWSSDIQRDLLLVLARRWSELSNEQKKIIEKKLKLGRKRIYPREPKDEHEKYSAYGILDRLYWLREQGCQFTFDYEAFSIELKKKAGGWLESDAQRAAKSLGMQSGGWVKTETSWDDFRRIPVNQIVEKVLSTPQRIEILTEHRPFLGICNDAPLKAISALSAAAKNSIYATDLWAQFLEHDGREKDNDIRFIRLIAGRLTQLPHQELQKFLLSVTRWLEKCGPILRDKEKDYFLRLWTVCIEVLEKGDQKSRPAVTDQGYGADWLTEAINAPAGNLAELVMTDPLIDGLKRGKGFPKKWIDYVKQLITLPAPSRQHALAIFSRNLDWFYAINSSFSSKTFLSLLERDSQNDDSDACWTGFFAGAKYPTAPLFKRIKPQLLDMATRESPQVRREVQTLSGLLLAGWGSKSTTQKRLVSNTELRAILLKSNEVFRTQILWHLSRWSGKSEREWSSQLVEFFENVWPKEKTIRTARISSGLCNVALSQEEHFPEIVNVILPHIDQTQDTNVSLFMRVGPEKEYIKLHPEALLDLLFAVLPEDPTQWPHNIGQILTKLEKQNPQLRKNFKLIELKNRLRKY